MSRAPVVEAPGQIAGSHAAPSGPPFMPQAPEEVERLAQALHRVRQRCPDLPLLAIRWMHVRHPLQETQERLLRGEARPGVALIRRLVQCVAYAVMASLQLAWTRWLVRRQLAALARRSFDVLAKTWCFSAEPPRDGRDFYYGDLQQRLAQRNVRMLLVCGDVSGRIRGAFAKGQISLSPMARIPELCLVHPLAPLQMMAQQIATCRRLWQLWRTEAEPLTRAILAFAGRECLAPDTALTGLLWWVGEAAVRIWRPKAVAALYEGQAWESCLWSGMKRADPACQTVGYQHTVLFPHCLALLGPGEDQRAGAKPDVVLCLGPQTQAALQPSHPRSRTLTFGTFRQLPNGRACAGPRPDARTVLVVPESGLVSEARLLFHVAMQAARALPDHQFIFRCHPIMPFDRVRPHLNEAPEALPNIEISAGAPIAEDFARSSAVLYRGSSSVLYAVLHGVKPIYVHDPSLRDADPLSAMGAWRESASSVQELAGLLRVYAATPAHALQEAWQEAAAFVRRYTVPVDEASLDRWLEDLRCGA